MQQVWQKWRYSEETPLPQSDYQGPWKNRCQRNGDFPRNLLLGEGKSASHRRDLSPQEISHSSNNRSGHFIGWDCCLDNAGPGWAVLGLFSPAPLALYLNFNLLSGAGRWTWAVPWISSPPSHIEEILFLCFTLFFFFDNNIFINLPTQKFTTFIYGIFMLTVEHTIQVCLVSANSQFTLQYIMFINRCMALFNWLRTDGQTWLGAQVMTCPTHWVW